jgi:TolB-like protein
LSLFEELKRRNVFRVGIAYVLISWLLLQGADFAFDLVGAPNWVIQSLSIVVVLGLPIALFFAWAYELTPEGIKREREVDRSQSITPNTGKKLNSAILVLMTLAIAYLLIDKLFISAPEHETAGIAITSEPVTSATEEQAAEPEVSRQSIAVLPFLALSSGPDDEFFADGLTEEILNSLAQLPELLVTARTSAFHFKGKNLTATEIAASLGVAHIVEGSVRRSGDRLRVTAQLIRANDGFHLWSENYDETHAPGRHPRC